LCVLLYYLALPLLILYDIIKFRYVEKEIARLQECFFLSLSFGYLALDSDMRRPGYAIPDLDNA